jgi:C-terminal processing protease CtpA/Prc
VTKDSPAARAGLAKGDVIVAMNGQPIDDSLELRLKVAQTVPGTEVRFTIRREGREQDVRVKLGELPEKAHAAAGSEAAGSPLGGVNHRGVPNTAAFDRAVQEGGTEPVLLLVNRQGTTRFVVVEPR